MFIRKSLKEIGFVKTNGVDKKISPDEEEVRLVNYMDVYRNHKLDNSFEFQIVTAKAKKKISCSLLEKDVLFTPSSETPDDIGHSAVVLEDLENAVYSYHLVRFRLHDSSIFDKDFLGYLFNQYAVLKHFASRATGTTRYTLGKNDFDSLELEYPESVAEQTAIATVLTKVDEAIDATESSIYAAEKLKQALMQNMLTGKLRADGSWRTEDEFVTDEKFGRVPVGWEIQKGSKITDKITKGQSPKWQGFEYGDSGMLFITSENVRDGYLDVSEPKFLPISFNNKIKGSRLQKGDILVNIVGASTGRSCLFNGEAEFANINQAVCLFRLQKQFCSRYFAYYFQNAQTVRRLLSSQVETARANLSLGDFRKFKLVFPSSKEEQESIANKIESFNAVLKSKQLKVVALQRLKKSLMQNLLTGKVRVATDQFTSLLA